MCDNGSIRTELSRRVGAARAEFETFGRVWNHTVLLKAGKVQFLNLRTFENVVLFFLHTTWLNKAELTRLNAFQAKCFRILFFLLAPF